MNVVIIKYNAGNIQSVSFALQRLGIEAHITDNHDEIRRADRVIFPGVGEASTTMNYLREHALDTLIPSLTQPVLGICLGLQLMCRYSEEGDTECLGIFDIAVRKFPTTDMQGNRYKIPHIGWNTIYNLDKDMFDNTLEQQHAYFVHSFYAETSPYTAAYCKYGVEFSAALNRRNFYATQFHPEKSGDVGHRILQRFFEL